MTLEEIYQLNKTRQGAILKFKADRLPVAFVFALFAVQIWAFFSLDRVEAVIFALCSLPFLGSAAIYNHHQQHHAAFNHAPLNRFFELILGMQTGIPSYAWVLHHNYGHHPNYMNQRPEDNEDESRWTRKDGSQMGRTEYTLNLFLYAPIDGVKVGLKRKKLFMYYWLMLVPYLGIQAAMAWHNWFNFLAVIFIPAVLMLTYVYWLTYEHHSGLYTKNELEASRNRVGPFYSFRTCNLGYHTAHHMKPFIHWSLLPLYHELIKDDIPDHCFVDCW